MPRPKPPDWTAIRRRYEETDAAVAAICADAGIDRAALDRRRKTERWRRQKPRGVFPAPQAARAGAVEPDAPRNGRACAGHGRKTAKA